jgi:predicted lipoprotein with Yx(FWY)xxD motif
MKFLAISPPVPRYRRALGATVKRSVVASTLVVAGLVLAACGSSGYGSGTTTTTHGGGATPGSSLATATVAGLGTVVVDGRGRTVYVLSSGATKNLACTSANGCTAVWPPLVLPTGAASAHAGSGIHGALLGHVVVGGVAYPTYRGWRLYEFSGDTGPAQAGGQGLSSYGGTWHALTVSGSPASGTASTTTSTYPGY